MNIVHAYDRPPPPDTPDIAQQMADAFQEHIEKIWQQIHKITEAWDQVEARKHNAPGASLLEQGATEGIELGKLIGSTDFIASSISYDSTLTPEHQQVLLQQIGMIRVALKTTEQRMRPMSIAKKNGNGKNGNH